MRRLPPAIAEMMAAEMQKVIKNADTILAKKISTKKA